MEYLYHHSPSHNRTSILKHGLLCSKSESAEMGGVGGIFFTTHPHRSFGSDCWKVNVGELPIEDDDTTDISGRPEYDGHKWYVVYDLDIQPNRLTLHRAAQMPHLLQTNS